MTMNNNKLCISILMIISIVAVVLLTVDETSSTNNVLGEYTILNEAICSGESFFYKSEKEFKANRLGDLIGYTTEGDQVYAIDGLNSSEWICIRCNGVELIYNEASLRLYNGFFGNNVSKMVVRKRSGLETILEITDISIIEELTQQLIEENIVTGEIVASDIKNICFYYDEYPGLEYICYYVIDTEENHFLYDSTSECSWKLIKPIFEN